MKNISKGIEYIPYLEPVYVLEDGEMGCSLQELQLLCLRWVCQDTPLAAQMAHTAEQCVLCQEHAWKCPVLVGLELGKR